MSDVSQHPSTAQLAAFLSGRIDDDDEQLWIEEHLERCPECSASFNLLSRDDSLLVRLRDQIEVKPSATQQSHGANKSLESTTLCGTTVGKYQITEVVGQGGMGVVYKARDSVILRDVAFKVLPPSVSQDREMMERLLTEARHAGRIADPHVVTVFDTSIDSDVGFVAMEYVGGGTVADLLKKEESVPWENATRILLQSCLGVAAAHREGLIHRDIKPGNLLLTPDGNVKVADFGLAKATETEHTASEAGAIRGTAHFMSPEQCRGEDIDERSDVYSLGATYFNLLTGKTPYHDMKQTTQIMFAHCHAKPPRASEVNLDVPQSCSDIVARCLHKSAAKRYQDCDELVADLQIVLDGSSPKSSGSIWRSLTEIPSGPSLIVLPFKNIGVNTEHDYFADGITHELISQLGRFRQLRLIASNTSFQFKDQAVDVRELGTELDVQYAVEGSVRRVGSRVRIAASLLKVSSSATLWTEAYNRDLSANDIFEVQDEIATQITSALAQPHGQLQVIERTRRDASQSLDAYDAVLRFYEYWHCETIELYWPVRELLEEVVAANPRYAQAISALALVYVNGFRMHGVETGFADLELSLELAKKALAVDPHCEMAHEALITAHFHRGEIPAFTKAAETALRNHPNHADLLADVGAFFTCLGKFERGKALADKALSLSPHPPDWYHSASVVRAIHYGDFELALSKAILMESNSLLPHLHRAVALAFLGRTDEAAVEISKALDYSPKLAEQIHQVLSLWNLPRDLHEKYVSGAQKAGLAAT